jgi:hypothetical protein
LTKGQKYVIISISNEREVTLMFTRVFEKENFDGRIDTINISDYGFEYYEGDKLARTGLVENLEETCEDLLNDDWVEVK